MANESSCKLAGCGSAPNPIGIRGRARLVGIAGGMGGVSCGIDNNFRFAAGFVGAVLFRIGPINQAFIDRAREFLIACHPFFTPHLVELGWAKRARLPRIQATDDPSTLQGNSQVVAGGAVAFGRLATVRGARTSTLGGGSDRTTAYNVAAITFVAELAFIQAEKDVVGGEGLRDRCNSCGGGVGVRRRGTAAAAIRFVGVGHGDGR